ncbi:hypothetical protein [Fodinibius salsisoli]|uniref:Uncharacterized protein n=1 Tax=Fodinibius salsisoli TaxID=2820877 RepID=A0ABT3PPM4_9BACT|nr:hypothetical protein [Fodinibius salsisoli]MCW9707815.1 hypothetical protein [Fodinibius salsisoli]
MSFSAKWFLVYYAALGFILILSGGYIAFQKNQIKQWFLSASEQEQPPVLLIRILKYLALFTLPGLILSFLPFSWIELLFTAWSLILLYLASIQLVRWAQSRIIIQQNEERLTYLIRTSGAIMLSVGFAILLLAYFVAQRS